MSRRLVIVLAAGVLVVASNPARAQFVQQGLKQVGTGATGGTGAGARGTNGVHDVATSSRSARSRTPPKAVMGIVVLPRSIAPCGGGSISIKRRRKSA